MKFARRCLAAFVLTMWSIALGHVALEHCAAMNGGCAIACAPDEDGHDDGASNGEGEQHHHFGTWLAQTGKALDGKPLFPLVEPVPDSLMVRLVALLREAEEMPDGDGSWGSPPDGRAAGWLLVCRTARPVRGPSLGV